MQFSQNLKAPKFMKLLGCIREGKKETRVEQSTYKETSSLKVAS